MRTTLQIDDDILNAARSLAETEQRSLGEVISSLARRGLAPQPQEDSDHGFPVFSVPADATPITPQMVRRAAEDDG